MGNYQDLEGQMIECTSLKASPRSKADMLIVLPIPNKASASKAPNSSKDFCFGLDRIWHLRLETSFSGIRTPKLMIFATLQLQLSLAQ